MKIAHLCLSVYFVEHFQYQENILIEKDKSNGHEVIVIASTETFDKDGRMFYCDQGQSVTRSNIPLFRVPYFFGDNFFSRKLRKYKGVIKILERFKPDVIFFHGTGAIEILSISRFVRNNPGVHFFIDSHEDWNNSARSWLSREVLHRLIYRPVLRSAMDVCEKLLCVSTDAIDFMTHFYGIESSKLELYPLGGNILDDADYNARRSLKRQQLGVSIRTRIFIQSGKQTVLKRLSDSLKAFCLAADKDSLFLIAGSLSTELRLEIQKLINNDSRIRYMGWCDPEALTDLLCAADVYVQPGTQSVTMQHSLSCRCAVILDDAPAHAFYKCDNGWYVSDSDSLLEAFLQACSSDLEYRKIRSFLFAKAHLDYSKLSLRYVS